MDDRNTRDGVHYPHGKFRLNSMYADGTERKFGFQANEHRPSWLLKQHEKESIQFNLKAFLD